LAKGPRYRVPLKRRRENKTNYHKRRVMVLAKTPRLVIRRSQKYITLQIIEALPQGDHTLLATTSKKLSEYGWKSPSGNIPAAYLTGVMIGHQAQSNGINAVIPDIGLRRASPGSRVFAVIKGAQDAGLNVPCGETMPDDFRITGQHIASYAETLLQTSPREYEKRFSQYISAGIKPQELPTQVKKVKTKIIQQSEKED
jgi:large subunit ribosomal protein L18